MNPAPVCIEHLRLRPECWPQDEVFLRALFASTRAEELRVTGWPPEVIRAFLDQQFDAQRAYYQREYDRASFDVVMAGDDPVGRLYVDRAPADLCVVDIALLPTARHHGIGRQLMQTILAEASAAGRAVTLHVEPNNWALTWYRRLGFRPVGDAGVYEEMRWEPPQLKTA